jgi:hypothetical protein
MKHKIFALISFFFFLSCSTIGITNDYEKLSVEQKESIIPIENFLNLNLENIYKINGSQLKNEIENHEKVLVYIFVNGCKSPMCKPFSVYENYAKKNGYKLFLVMNGYGNLDKSLIQPRQTPLLAIDGDQYNTIYRGSYERQFMNEISGKPRFPKGKYTGDKFFFNKGKLEKLVWELPQ